MKQQWQVEVVCTLPVTVPATGIIPHMLYNSSSSNNNDRTMLANLRDIVLHDKKVKTCLLISIAIDDSNVNTKDTENLGM